jgi:pyruvate/2-oxoglutarate/acetoin dehydrogenase E1 component
VGDILTYKEAITESMTWLGKQDNTIFLGQSVRYSGNAMFDTLKDVPMSRRLELPVAEELQMGVSIGMSLMGKIPISIYPRFDFLLCAVNQLVNHLDKLDEFTHKQFQSKVIIRVGIGSKSPMYPGIQHCSDYTDVFKQMLKNIMVLKIETPTDALIAYRAAYEGHGSFMIVEDMEAYDRVV